MEAKEVNGWNFVLSVWSSECLRHEQSNEECIQVRKATA